MAVLISIVILIVITAIFLIEMVTATNMATQSAEATPDQNIEAVVAALLVDTDPANGEALMERYGCAACHVIGADSGIAPHLDLIGDVAATRHPPLSAAAYIYESITNPGAFVVEGYQNTMAADFKSRVSEQELGDIIAYLLTLRAQ
ncbi:MAG: cytochrome c [Chloroflexota bacterium]|nr:cytochrome c [Chloroflexota bacterium]